jgi:hypothetical protein
MWQGIDAVSPDDAPVIDTNLVKLRKHLVSVLPALAQNRFQVVHRPAPQILERFHKFSQRMLGANHHTAGHIFDLRRKSS